MTGLYASASARYFKLRSIVLLSTVLMASCPSLEMDYFVVELLIIPISGRLRTMFLSTGTEILISGKVDCTFLHFSI